MSWYGNHSDSSKKLDALLDQNPTLQDLFNFPQFIQQLKSYNPKLLQYLSNSTQIPKQIVTYLTKPPIESDSNDRKFKLPLYTIAMIETETTCILNMFFKINPSNGKTYLLTIFEELLMKNGTPLPLLCGYFLKLNVILSTNRYKQVIDAVYQNQECLLMLVRHCDNQALSNILQFYINLDMTKNSVQFIERLNLKLQILKQLMEIIRKEYQEYCQNPNGPQSQKNQIIVENIGEIFSEVIQKYYLIADGKFMLEILISQQNIELLFNILLHNSSMSHSVINTITFLLRYYAFSSFNIQQSNPQLAKKNLQRLQGQPIVIKIIQIFPKVITMINNAPKIQVYHSKLIDILSLSMSLSSKKILSTVKSTKYIEFLINLIFKYPTLSIIHRQLDKLFYCLFNNDRLIYQDYKKYLFCQAEIIQMTAGRYLNSIGNLQEYKAKNKGAHEGYFGFLMRIIKVYSKIQTNDEDINKSIVKRSELWEKFNNNVLRPYENTCFKELSSYQNIPNPPPIQYSIKYIAGYAQPQTNNMSKKLIDQINREESMQLKSVEAAAQSGFPQQSKQKPKSQQIQDTLFKNVVDMAADPFPHIQIKTVTSSEEKIEKPEQNKEGSNFQQFLQKQKVEADKELKLIRSTSQQRRLSAGKARVTSPSPKRKNKWEQNKSEQQIKPTQEQKKVIPQKISLTTGPKPFIPSSRKPNHQISSSAHGTLNTSLSGSAVSIDQSTNLASSQAVDKHNPSIQDSKRYSKSSINLNNLKNIKIKSNADKPAKTEYRRIKQSDFALLDYIGIKY